jgi:uncharacterized protein YecE (DUF72 family)
MPRVRIGTSSFTASGWETTFYPAGLKDADRLTYYATKFDTVEIDATFYRVPALSTVKGWRAKTPADFTFALKVPQAITHEKVLVDCDDDLKAFLDAASLLAEKLGPLLFQFGYFNRSVFKSQAEFLARLKPFLAKLPKGFQFAIEIRNKDWLDARLSDLLREHEVALAMIDQGWMPRPWEVKTKVDWLTAPGFSYARLLGDRNAIEGHTKTWDKVIVDRKTDLEKWLDYWKRIERYDDMSYIYLNNHYSGFAPATAETLRKMWNNTK